MIEGHAQNSAPKSGDENSTTLLSGMKPYNNIRGPDDQCQVRQNVDGIKGDAKSTLD